MLYLFCKIVLGQIFVFLFFSHHFSSVFRHAQRRPMHDENHKMF